MEDDNNVTAAAQLGAALADPQQATTGQQGTSIPYVLVPDGYELKDLDSLFTKPSRKCGGITLLDAASFCTHIESQRNDDSVIYCNPHVPRFTVVFNEHAKDAAGWRDHTATWACPVSVEWTTWTGQNGKQLSHEKFAQFIEDNAPDCVMPDSATMIEISRSLEAKKSVQFGSSKRLDNGEHIIAYEEKIEGTVGKGQMPVPERFVIGIAPLDGGPKYRLDARWRYRISQEGKLTMWFDLDRPHKIMEQAVKEVSEWIAAKTGMTVLNAAG